MDPRFHGDDELTVCGDDELTVCGDDELTVCGDDDLNALEMTVLTRWR